MSDLNGSGQTEITHRTSDYRPPRSFSNWLIRRPLRTADASQQAIGKGIGLAVFASDALSSTAHATQETLAISLLTGGVHEGTLQGLRYARLLSEGVTAVHVCIDPADAETVQKKWLIWGEDTRLVILDSPCRAFIEPLLGYLQGIIENRQPDETITIVVPQFIPTESWHHALYMRTAELLCKELPSRSGVVVIDVPYRLVENGKVRHRAGVSLPGWLVVVAPQVCETVRLGKL